MTGFWAKIMLKARGAVARGAVAMAVLGLALASPLSADPLSADPLPATEVIGQFNQALLGVMKNAAALGYEGRAKALREPVNHTYDMATMSLMILGTAGRALSPADQTRVADAFTRLTVATYADQFDGYSGEKFTVSPAIPSQRGLVIVPSQIIATTGDPVALDYLMRPNDAGDWRIVDVLLAGSVSQVAVRRSELLALFRAKGADGLVAALDAKVAELANKGH